MTSVGVFEAPLPDYSSALRKFPHFVDGSLEFAAERPFRDCPELIAQLGMNKLPEVKHYDPLGRNYVGFVALVSGGNIIIPEPAKELAEVIALGVQSFTPEHTRDLEEYSLTWSKQSVADLEEDEVGWHFDGNDVVATFGGVGTEFILANFPRDKIAGKVRESELDMIKFWQAPQGSIVKKQHGTVHRSPELTLRQIRELQKQGNLERVVVTINDIDDMVRIEPTRKAVAQSLVSGATNVFTMFSHAYAERDILEDKARQKALLEYRKPANT